MPWTYEDAERELLDRELFGMRFGLDRMRRLLTALDHPERSFAAIHVVGTNGKSSTARMAAELLRRHGLRAGAYLSPHLRTFAERVVLDGRDAPEPAFAAAVERAVRAAEKVDRTLEPDDRVTQFELLTAAAFVLLASSGVEAAAIEAGLGGRYDATNVIPSRVTALTNVGLEHTRWLGPTVADIAREKLAVLQPSTTLVVGDIAPEAEPEVAAAVRARAATLVRTPAEPPVPVAALGAFQRRNFALACSAVEAFLDRALDAPAVRAAAQLKVPGRLEVIGERPLTVLDGAHNPSGMEALVAALGDLRAGRRLIAVASILDDKDAPEMLRILLRDCAGLVATANTNPRSLSPATLASLARQLGGPEAALETDPAAALALGRELAGPDGMVVATGSIYLVGDLRAGRRPGERASSL
jgi:dihydrofolate synthase/folylpolyglutamate synthase